jgi:hypothetical protein
MRTKGVKLKNRRVFVGRRESDDSICLFFKRLKSNDDINPYSATEIIGKIVETKLCISKAAAVSLYLTLRDTITIDDIVEFEKESGQKVLVD